MTVTATAPATGRLMVSGRRQMGTATVVKVTRIRLMVRKLMASAQASGHDILGALLLGG